MCVVCQNIPAIMTGLSGTALVVRTAIRRTRGTTPGRYDGGPRAPQHDDCATEPRAPQAAPGGATAHRLTA